MMLFSAIIMLTLILNGSSMSNYDVLSMHLMNKEAAEWYGEFKQLLLDQPENQELIFKYFIRGLMYNFYTKYDRSVYEPLFIDAYTLLSNNPKIMRQMSKSSNPNPIMKLYRHGSNQLKQAMYPLAIRAEWNSTVFAAKQRATHYELAKIQETLRTMTNDIRIKPMNVHQIPSILTFCSEYFRDLARSNPLDPIQIDIAVTTFQLTMEISHIARSYYPEATGTYFKDVIDPITLITAGDITKANKIMSIISDEAQQLVDSFVIARQYLINNAAEQHTRSIQFNYAEKLMADLQRFPPGDKRYLKDIFKLFDEIESYLRDETLKAKRDEKYLIEGYKYEYPLVLFEAVVWFCKSFDRSEIRAWHINGMVGYVAKLIPNDVHIRGRITDTLYQAYPRLETQFLQSIPLEMADSS